jgi:pimeloyl-ACP methyl ester carboxylesterase
VEGPEHGTPLVLVHGATVPHWAFDLLAPRLHAAGVRTLRFDLFGHGMSDRPAIGYTLDLFARQTVEIIEAVGFPRPTAILGHSVGAAIAARVSAERPDLIERIALVAPMLDFGATTHWAPAFRLPGIGEALMRFVGVPALVRRRRRKYTAIGQPQLIERFVEEVSYAGFWQALLSMVRSETLGDQSARYAALRGLARDVLVISGTADTVIPRRDVARICDLVASCRHVAIDGAEHNLLLTHAAQVAAALRSHLGADPPSGPERERSRPLLA